MKVFNFARALGHRTQSIHTQRAYFRWIDRYLSDHYTGRFPIVETNRAERMRELSVASLTRHLSQRKLDQWLQRLVRENHSRQTLDQARAAIVTLAEMVYEAGHMERDFLQMIRDVHVPKIKRKLTPERLLTDTEIRTLADAVMTTTGSENQRRRNAVIAHLLWSLALRRDELSVLRWQDIVLRDGKPYLMIETDAMEISRPLLQALDQWRSAFSDSVHSPTPGSPLLRRIWKGGRIAADGLSPDGVWLIIHQASLRTALGAVTPDDLRRSVIAQMYENGASLRDINHLLRHRSLIITERFLAKLIPPTDPDNPALPSEET